MKTGVLIILNYYAPYISGVTEYARLAAEMLVKKGCDVTVLASNHDHLPPEEIINGVKVVRSRVWFRISKGVISPGFIRLARKLGKQADVVNMHLPMLESGLISLLTDRKKLVSVYQCDVNLPPSLLNKLITGVMDLSHKICLRRSKTVCVTSKDYGAHSRVAAAFTDKMTELTGPVKDYRRVEVPRIPGKKVIGFCGRIVEEKGVDVLLRAFETLRRERDDVVLRIAGDYKTVAGGSVYPELKKYIDEHHLTDVEFLGKLPEGEMAAFFSGLDVFVLPSVNSLEAYGLVQVEAMECGAPVVASDLYGVRTIVGNTGAGLICKAGDAGDLARCLREVLDHREEYAGKLKDLSKHYSNERWAELYAAAILGAEA